MFTLFTRLFEMREGLRSQTRLRAEREMIDLNKDPVEEGSSSKSPTSSAYFSAEEKVDSGFDLDVSSNAVGEGGNGDKGGTFRRCGGVNSQKLEGKDGCAFPWTDVGPVTEGLSEFLVLPLEGKSCAAIVKASGGGVEIKDEAAGKKRRGRKRKVLGGGLSNAEGMGPDSFKELEIAKVARAEENGNKHDGLSNAEGLRSDSVKEEEGAKVARAEQNGSKHEILEPDRDADKGINEAPVSAGNTDEGREKPSKGWRGRKRKVLESSGRNMDSPNAGSESKRLALDGTPQIFRRVLRSTTREANAGEKQAAAEDKGLEDGKGETDLDGSGKVEVTTGIEEKAWPTESSKGRRGRPPKMHGRNGCSSSVSVSQKVKLGPQKEDSAPGAKVVKGSNLVKLRKKKVTPALLKVHREKNMDKKEEDVRPKKEKQLLKDQIIGILKEAGWTIDYRPRNGREYLDAVYVDGLGRTHWSVTLAYKKLKQRIENGTADAKEVSAFTPIPDDRLSMLFRIIKKKKKSERGLKASGSKTGTGGLKERLDEESAGETIAVPKTRSSMSFSGRRKPKLKREEGRKPCALLPRKSKIKLNEGKGTLLSWMIDLGTISLGGKVRYMGHEKTDVTFHGKITREGICCECCDKIFTLVDFESHAGGTRAQPLQNIHLESGKSLLQCMSESWSKQEDIDHIGFNVVSDEDDPDDDTCNICADGGDLTCCDGCFSTFHDSCLQIEPVPDDVDWQCVYCSCKFCGIVCWGISQGDDVLDPDDSGFFTCLFCEEKFHVNCMLKEGAMNFNTELFPFCGRGCQKLYENLEQLLGVKHKLEEGYSWSILRRQDVSCNADSLKVESNSKLAIAFSVLDECFTPITDEKSKINVIRSVCYSCGSNLRRLNYTGFCTFILEKSGELVSTATLRIHGNELAEMPFIGTREIHRRKGMCRRLLGAIEMALSSLNVKNLVIPAVSELSETWTKVFGFVPVKESRRLELKYMSLVLFPGSDMLQKPLCRQQITNGAELSRPSFDHTRGIPSTAAATVGSCLPITDACLNRGPGNTNELTDSITYSNDDHHYDGSEDKVTNSASGTPEMIQVDKISCLTEEDKRSSAESA